MVELADIFRRAGPAFREAFQGRILPSHLRALEDIAQCRTPALGGSVYACDDCGALHYAYHSCPNRHCPKCQEDRAQAWLESLRSRLLPCAHYLSRYLYRVALSNNRIERFEHDRVTFRYTHARTRETRRITLPVHDFIARFLQHVLPRAFPKIRYYGLLSPSSRPHLERARHLLEFASSQLPPLPAIAPDNDDSGGHSSVEPLQPRPPRVCPVCKRGHLHLHSILLRARPPP